MKILVTGAAGLIGSYLMVIKKTYPIMKILDF